MACNKGKDYHSIMNINPTVFNLFYLKRNPGGNAWCACVYLCVGDAYSCTLQMGNVKVHKVQIGVSTVRKRNLLFWVQFQGLLTFK